MLVYFLAVILHYIQVQAQSLTPIYAVLISLASLIASGLLHFGLYLWREGRKDKAFEDIQSDMKDFKNRLIMMELKFAALTGQVNGGHYRK